MRSPFAVRTVRLPRSSGRERKSRVSWPITSYCLPPSMKKPKRCPDSAACSVCAMSRVLTPSARALSRSIVHAQLGLLNSQIGVDERERGMLAGRVEERRQPLVQHVELRSLQHDLDAGRLRAPLADAGFLRHVDASARELLRERAQFGGDLLLRALALVRVGEEQAHEARC